jgi:hypothetical protein
MVLKEQKIARGDPGGSWGIRLRICRLNIRIRWLNLKLKGNFVLKKFNFAEPARIALARGFPEEGGIHASGDKATLIERGRSLRHSKLFFKYRAEPGSKPNLNESGPNLQGSRSWTGELKSLSGLKSEGETISDLAFNDTKPFH